MIDISVVRVHQHGACIANNNPRDMGRSRGGLTRKNSRGGGQQRPLAAAIWLVFAQTLGFATGGYLAGRLRSPAFDGVAGETLFRDAAQGFVGNRGLS